MSATAGEFNEASSPGLLSVCALCGAIFLLWSGWAIVLRELVVAEMPSFEVSLGVLARLICWVLPCGVYLVKVWGSGWARSLGLGFPLGAGQIKRTLLICVFMTWALFAATAARNRIPILGELEHFISSAEPRFTAPIFEELVFRGTILATLLEWTHRSSRSAWELRSRYWIVQLSCAVFFVLIHWPAWWDYLGYSAILERSVPIFAVALVLGFVFAQTRSIWPCIWVHWLNNELSLMA